MLCISLLCEYCCSSSHTTTVQVLLLLLSSRVVASANLQAVLSTFKILFALLDSRQWHSNSFSLSPACSWQSPQSCQRLPTSPGSRCSFFSSIVSPARSSVSDLDLGCSGSLYYTYLCLVAIVNTVSNLYYQFVFQFFFQSENFSNGLCNHLCKI